MNSVRTSWAPPKISVVTAVEPPSASRSRALEMTGRSIRAASRPATSREV